MKYLLIITFILSGCSTVVPVKYTFPSIPQSLLEPCQSLKPLENKVSLSEYSKVIVYNYSLYHECALKNKSWQEWYDIQKDLFKSDK